MSTENDRDKIQVTDASLDRRRVLLGTTALAAASAIGTAVPSRLAQAQQQPAAASGGKPKILVIFGDDIGMWNISAYSRGMMGYRTANIDRIAREGAMFTDLYAQQSCTAGCAACAEALTKELRDKLTPDQIIDVMKKGNARFRKGERKERNYLREQKASASGQYPAAALLTCIDSRAPAEVIMDLGLGDIFNARVAGNVENGDTWAAWSSPASSQVPKSSSSWATSPVVQSKARLTMLSSAISRDCWPRSNLQWKRRTIKASARRRTMLLWMRLHARTSSCLSRTFVKTARCLPSWNPRAETYEIGGRARPIQCGLRPARSTPARVGSANN